MNMDMFEQIITIAQAVGEVGLMPIIIIVLLVVLIQVIRSDSQSREDNSNSIIELSKMLKEILFIQRIQNDTLKIILGNPELFNLIIKNLKKEAVVQAYNDQGEESDRTFEAIDKLKKAKEGFDAIEDKHEQDEDLGM
jgi:hypothetical protein